MPNVPYTAEAAILWAEKKRKQPFYGGQHQCLWNKSTSIRTWDTAEAWGASVPHFSEVTRFLLNFRLNVNSAHKMAAPALLRWQIHCKCRMSPPAFERGEIKIKNTQMKNGRSLPTPEPVPYISIHNHIFRYLFNPMEKKKNIYLTLKLPITRKKRFIFFGFEDDKIGIFLFLF